MKLKSPPPMAFNTQQHKHKRSSSFGDWALRILPSRRGERGYTLREDDGDSFADEALSESARYFNRFGSSLTRQWKILSRRPGVGARNAQMVVALLDAGKSWKTRALYPRKRILRCQY